MENSSLIHSLLEAQNTDGYTALHLACRRGSAELVEAIVAYQQNVDILDKDESPPIVFALAAGSPECVRALIRRSANVNSMLREGLGPSLAHICAHHGQPECMQVRHHVHLCFEISWFLFLESFYVLCRNCSWLELIPMQ